MCGLVGFLSFERPFERERGQRIVREMAKALDYRGPDMDGYWSSPDERCHLGHKRLAVIDLTEAGRQPMLDDTGRYAIVFNGEIYNFQELRDRLAGAGIAFRTKSDTEVLLKGYIAHGNAWFAQLDGQFALAIYDTHARTMVLARDRAGEKPLYYRATEGLFLFGSELHALTRMPDLQWEMSPTAVALYMLYRYVPAPHSIVEGVRKLKPGCLLTIDADGKLAEQRYYAFEVDPQVGASQEDFLKTCDRVEAAMIESLRRRLISDVPVGMFLSSGIDSSLVCALSARKLGVTPRTFTIGFEGDDGSEHETARAIAKHLGTQHSEHVFGASDFDSVGRRIGTLMDEPNGDRSCVPTYLLCKFAREQVTVALSGDGGDELFGGYGRYGFMRKQFSKPEDIDPRKAIGAYYNSALPVFGLPPIHQALPDTVAALDAELDVSLPLFQHPARDVIHGLRQMDFAYYMPGAVLAKVDRMSMRNSLETRTPFFEIALLSEATRLPTAYCISPDDMKKLVLREIAGRYLPREVALLPKKGFGMPASVFLNNIKAVQQEVRNAFEILAATRFFSGRRSALKAMQGAAENINAAWAFIVLGQWAAHFPARL